MWASGHWNGGDRQQSESQYEAVARTDYIAVRTNRCLFDLRLHQSWIASAISLLIRRIISGNQYHAIFFFQRIQSIEILWSYANQVISSNFNIILIYRSHTLGPSQSSVREQLEIVTQVALKHGGDGIVCVEGKEENERLWTLRKECLWSAMARCLIL